MVCISRLIAMCFVSSDIHMYICTVPDAIPLYGGNVPDGTSLFSLTNVACTGSENRILHCPADVVRRGERGRGGSDCPHSSDAGVLCSSPTPCTLQGAVRISGRGGAVDGPTVVEEGRVEVCNRKVWGSVCAGSSWDDAAARVVCRQLGLPSSGM